MFPVKWALVFFRNLSSKGVSRKMSRMARGKVEDPKKKPKQQAASLARRMAGKKGQSTQLQVEVNNEEDWEKLLTKEGLIVIDVYSEWSGPCVGMIGNLKKAKVDLGGDNLQLAIAKNDEIECLARFRNRSEPTWMFVAGGQLITLTFGANAPKLMKMIEAEVKYEMRVLKGETWRRGGPFTELTEEEKERLEAAEKLKTETERLEAERKAREILEKRMKTYSYMAENLLYETVIVCFPHTISPDLGCAMSPDLDLFCRNHMMYIATQYKMHITKELVNEIFFRESIEISDDLLEDLESGPCLVMLLKCQIIGAPGQEGEKKLGDIEKIICESLYSTTIERDQELVIPAPLSLPTKYPYVKPIKPEEGVEEGEEEEAREGEIMGEVTSVPGCWTPATYITKSACVRFLFPARAEKVMLMEEPPEPPKVVIAFDISKQKECFDIKEEYEDDVLKIGYFSGVDPATAEHLCATPEQYAKLQHYDFNKLIMVVKKVRSEPLLSLAGLGACYVSLDEKVGMQEADLFFPPGVEPRFPRVEEAERAELLALEQTVQEEPEAPPEEEEEEPEDQNEDDLMALLGVTVE